MKRREFLNTLAAGAAGLAISPGTFAIESAKTSGTKPPNLVFVFADQWRAQATGYAGDPNALTPHLDQLAAQSLNFTHAVSGCPVCSPYRASLLTGQYWQTHGVFLNDVHLRDDAVSIAEALVGSGYDTAYIGKWHLEGHGRSSFIPPEHRQGFQYWRVQECTHDYNHSKYYADEPVPKEWEGYDAITQTREAQQYVRNHATDRPFALFLSWGPPHNPYETAPESCQKRITSEKLVLRPNVPEASEKEARRDLAGYYAHICALDDCIGDLLATLDECRLSENTVFVFTSDHGDMLFSQGMIRKQKPYDESLRVPFLLRYPARLGTKGRNVPTLLNAPDIMPTLLGLCAVPIPSTVEGKDLSTPLLQGEDPQVDAALLLCMAPFGEWTRKQGGRECRGIRTLRYTYVRDLNGPWLLFDNEADPYQQKNLCNSPENSAIQHQLDDLLQQKLNERNDRFLPAEKYIQQFGYTVDKTGTVPYSP